MLRPWSAIPIDDAGEPLEALPMALLRLEPHPYQVLGAPYGTAEGPFRLRRGVIERLLQAQEQLQRHEPGWRLAIFDAWRPVAVQRFMVRHTVIEECGRLGLDPAPALALVQGDAKADAIVPAQRQVVEQVGRFWAPPSDDPATPPPHSTGAAVDLTLADSAGVPLAMGGAIDALDVVSEPDHYRAAAERDPTSEAATWQRRRQGLRQAMEAAGFRQHPNEWWHFSHGDQLWAWRQGAAQARYGRCPD
ncbi:M15 family metallopeptidase [Synechococcus sp. CS-1328]|uniref:M15 family metallopeptidase n=1 Tax=Synechococcus sp. CS-1328 TaxID=2847976 RepID=UPI00223B0AC4|nr:M15 family metallopeptidase [Synechococcus sp. CS-1328]MCT0226283.1 D-alanyl-D-alanine dipeptidase [Synechococcus sp. CS-1328]